MSEVEIQTKNTKLQAFKLVHDPVQLFCLLFLKYGLTSEDFFISFINQIIFNDISHYTILYKEQIYNICLEEYIKKSYKFDDSKRLIIKINKHNQNYFRFFSKPIFTDFYFNKFLGNYYDNKAEIFYLNDYSGKKNTKIIRENELKNAINYNISSFDNDTQILNIFNKRMKKMIDNNLNSRELSISLTMNTKNEFNNSNKISTSESLRAIYDDLFIKNSKLENTIVNSDKNDLNKKEVMKRKGNKFTINDDSEKYIQKKLKLSNDYKNITNNNKYIIDQNLKKAKSINNINNQTLEVQQIDNLNSKQKSDFNQSKMKENYLEINSPRIIYNKSMNTNNLKKFSPLYKKPKFKIKNKLEISKKSSSKKQASNINLNTLKISQKTTKLYFYSPQNNKIKYIFNDLKSSLKKKLDSIELDKDNYNFGKSNIYVKSELPLINKENSVKKLNNNGLLSSDNRISKKIKLNAYPFKNSNIRIIKKSPKNKINTPRINFNKFSLDLKGINQAKKLTNFSQDKILDKNINIININIEKKSFNYIKNNFLKKLRPSYSMNKEIESFNNDIKTIDFNNNANTKLSRNSINKNIKSNTKYLLEEKQNRTNNIKQKKIIYPINLIKTTNQI